MESVELEFDQNSGLQSLQTILKPGKNISRVYLRSGFKFAPGVYSYLGRGLVKGQPVAAIYFRDIEVNVIFFENFQKRTTQLNDPLNEDSKMVHHVGFGLQKFFGLQQPPNKKLPELQLHVYHLKAQTKCRLTVVCKI